MVCMAKAVARFRMFFGPTAAEIEESERLYVERLMHTPDAIEGLRAFMEKRAPAWK